MLLLIMRIKVESYGLSLPQPNQNHAIFSIRQIIFYIKGSKVLKHISHNQESQKEKTEETENDGNKMFQILLTCVSSVSFSRIDSTRL